MAAITKSIACLACFVMSSLADEQALMRSESGKLTQAKLLASMIQANEGARANGDESAWRDAPGQALKLASLIQASQHSQDGLSLTNVDGMYHTVRHEPLSLVEVTNMDHVDLHRLNNRIRESQGLEFKDEHLDPNNPCSYVGCNSHKCEWASGGVIARLASKKTCRNAKILGNDGTIVAETEQFMVSGTRSLFTVKTLKDCLHAVKDTGDCAGEFEVNTETFMCSCVTAGETCDETEHDKVCRYKIKMMP